MEQIDAVTRLIASYKKLPGIGNKTAERLAYATLGFSREELEAFADSLKNVEENVHLCPKCHMPIDSEKCPVCDDPSRDHGKNLVVTDAKNILSFERGKYRGLYFVLAGNLSAVKGIGPNEIGVPELKQRVADGKISEVIVACSSTMDGELTAKYIATVLEDTGRKITRLAYGLPVGADLEYVDERTIERAFSARTDMKGEE